MKMSKTGLLSLALVFIISLNGYSQGFWEWTDPIPLTDSLSDNSNPYLLLTSYGYDASLLMFWEKRIDSLSTAIYMDNILDEDTAAQVLYTPGVSYSNPQVINVKPYAGPDASFYLLFESNQNGNIDIYYKVGLLDGTYLEAVALTNSPSDEVSFTIGNEHIYWDGGPYLKDMLAYIRNDSLFARNLISESDSLYFDEEILIDVPSCSNPVGAGESGNIGLTYLKSDTGEYHIYQASCDYTGNWSTPELIYDSADCRNITLALNWGNIVWSAYRDSSWKIMTTDYWGIYTYDSISKDNPFDPAALGFVIGVKSWAPELWIATPYSENDTDEIFMSIWPGHYAFEDFTGSGVPNRNPQFFRGESDSYACWFDYMVWESYRNGHWQIWASKTIQCVGSVKETNTDEQFISVHSNPFSNETTLEFTLDEAAVMKVEVINSSGKIVDNITDKTYTEGTHQLRWNSQGLPAGMYIIKMTLGDKTYTSKIIKSR
jgi:hypothetical protein